MSAELLKEYKDATDNFLAAARVIPANKLYIAPAQDDWSAANIIHHLADSEAQSYARLRRLIAEPGSIIQGYDEGLWAENPTLGYRTRDTATSIAVFAAVRRSS